MMTDEKFMKLLKEAGPDENKLKQLLKAEGINLDEMIDEELDQVDGGWPGLLPPGLGRIFGHCWGPVARTMYEGPAAWERHRLESSALRRCLQASSSIRRGH